MSWDSEMARLFKERNNKVFSGFVIGMVKLVKPLIISIEDGQVMLDECDLYTLQSLTDKTFEIGELVALLPDKTEQKYLILDRVKKGGV